MTDETSPGIPTPDGAAAVIDTDYEIGQDNKEGSVGPFGFDIHNPVFAISGVCIVAFVFYTLALPEQSGALFTWLFSSVTKGFDWFFISAGNIFVLFCLFLIITPLGRVRLGGAEASPDYTYLGWFSMLFAAGMGIVGYEDLTPADRLREAGAGNVLTDLLELPGIEGISFTGGPHQVQAGEAVVER